MLSNKELSALTKTKIQRKPRYVRIPLQMSNRVRDLKTNFNIDFVTARYNRCISMLEELSPTRTIYHLRMDRSTSRDWFYTYGRFCDAFRSLNNSRPIRRLHVTGFRMVNIETLHNGYILQSDTYISDLDCACVVLDSLARFMIPTGRITVLLHFNTSERNLTGIRNSIFSLESWNRVSWRLNIEHVTHLDKQVLQLSVPLDQAAAAINLAATVGGSKFVSADFRFFGLRMDCTILSSDELAKRYGSTNINVLLSGNRLRCFQKLGQLTKYRIL